MRELELRGAAQILQKHYGANGYVKKSDREPFEEIRLQAVELSKKIDPAGTRFTLGEILEMARFGQDCYDAGCAAQAQKAHDLARALFKAEHGHSPEFLQGGEEIIERFEEVLASAVSPEPQTGKAEAGCDSAQETVTRQRST